MPLDFLDKVYKLCESVDVYLSELNNEIKIQFFRINTREKLSLLTTQAAADLLAAFDGVKTIKELLPADLSPQTVESLEKFIDFLCSRNILVDKSHNSAAQFPRFSRQIAFFEDWIKTADGSEQQRTLGKSQITIFGTGAVGSALAILLARSGINKFRIIDYKRVSESSRLRHYFFREKYIGWYKVDALADYLALLNKRCEVLTFREKIMPDTELESMVAGADLVVNTADEPYIGHINMKLGRYLWPLNIAMYAAGGFDAHLMSTGELIIPGQTPCIDCYMKTFQKSLANWKPVYAPLAPMEVLGNGIASTAQGGLAQMSLFSASYAALQIIQYLLGSPFDKGQLARRGEFLPDKGKISWFNMGSQEGCDVCNH